MGEIILCQIPTISDKTAVAIMNKCGTIYQLISELKQNPHFLDEIQIIQKDKEKEKSRKISKTSIANIIKFLKINV